jgi:hypothetical protein
MLIPIHLRALLSRPATRRVRHPHHRILTMQLHILPPQRRLHPHTTIRYNFMFSDDIFRLSSVSLKMGHFYIAVISDHHFLPVGLPYLPCEPQRHGVWLWTPGDFSLTPHTCILVPCCLGHFQFWKCVEASTSSFTNNEFTLQTCCDCGQHIELCPICRTPIATRIKLY